jgi:hypothetical protein
VIRNQDLHSVPPTSGGVGVGVESEARGRHSRIANAIADARPECRQPAMQKTETQPQNQPQPEVAAEVPVPENEVPPVSQEDPSPGSAAPSRPLRMRYRLRLKHTLRMTVFGSPIICSCSFTPVLTPRLSALGNDSGLMTSIKP